MKRAIFLVLFAALGCNTAGNHTNAPKDNTPAIAMPVADTWQTNHTLNGKWQLIPALPSDTATGRVPVLNFNMTTKKVTGNTGCNSFSGTFSADQNALTFNQDLVSTKMACPGYDEAAFVKNLLRTNNFEINDDTLNLKVNQTPLSYWIRVQ